MKQEIEAGQEFRVVYPFIRETFIDPEDSGKEKPCWVPGIRSQDVYPDDSEAIADGVGEVIITVVGVYKPGSYPERVFYTRKWQDPTGKVFGKNKLIIQTRQAFNRRITRYLYDYRVEDQGEIAKADLGGI